MSLDTDQTRRLFLGQAGASLGLLWLGSMTPDLLAQAHAHAQQAGKSTAKTYRFFTPQQAAEFDAFSAQIIPSDDTPGAREANIVHFTDYVLSTIDSDQQAQMGDALKALNDQAGKTVAGAASFAALTSRQQIEAMKAMEKTEAFGVLRGFTLTGFFCDPSMGGNKDKVGWKLIGFEDKFLYQPPFGYYDAHYDEGKA
jgi:gluconate 2-dehydrogenase gamma chain